MKDYIKPTFILAGVAPVAMTAGGCDVDEAGKALIEDMHGFDFSKDFLSDKDLCSNYVSDYEGYCKYTAGDMGLTSLIGS